METLLHSLEVSALITGGITLFMCLALIPRLHTLWKTKRQVKISMPCQDAEQARFRISEVFKSIGQATAPTANGSFTIEPAKWRRQLGITTISVIFPEPRLALISGQTGVLKLLAKSQKLPLLADSNATFGAYLKGKIKWPYWATGCMFVVLFLLIAIHDSQGEPRKPRAAVSAESAPGETGSR
jgi:hypothetical protein